MMFTETVEKIRLIKGTKNVPGFDPNNGNENAQYLFLLEAPGQGSVKSGTYRLTITTLLPEI